MAAPERFAQMSDFPLAPRAPSIHGTRLASRPLRLMSALRQQSGLAAREPVAIIRGVFGSRLTDTDSGR